MEMRTAGKASGLAVVLVIILGPQRDRFAALGTAMLIGVAQRIDAAAIFLLVKLFALADLDHALGAAALAPVEIPVAQAVVSAGGAVPAIVDLGHVLPARNAERRGHDRKIVLMGVKRRALEAHVKTHGAARPALGLPFHALGPRKPVFVFVSASIKGTPCFSAKRTFSSLRRRYSFCG